MSPTRALPVARFWSPVFPGTEIARQEVIEYLLKIMDDLATVKIRNDKRRMYAIDLMSLGVLSFAQVGKIVGYSRQWVHQLAAENDMPLPRFAVNSWFEPDSLRVVKLVIDTILDNRPVPNEILQELVGIGTPRFVAHLTGITYAVAHNKIFAFRDIPGGYRGIPVSASDH